MEGHVQVPPGVPLESNLLKFKFQKSELVPGTCVPPFRSSQSLVTIGFESTYVNLYGKDPISSKYYYIHVCV